MLCVREISNMSFGDAERKAVGTVSQPTSKTHISLWSSMAPLSLFILCSLFMWSIFSNVIPPSPSYSSFRSFSSDSSNLLDYLWVLWTESLHFFLCVCVQQLDGYGLEYLMSCWTSTMRDVPQFPFQSLDTDEKEGGLEGYAEDERERHRQIERDSFRVERYHSGEFTGKCSVKHFFTYASEWPQRSTLCLVHIASALLQRQPANWNHYLSQADSFVFCFVFSFVGPDPELCRCLSISAKQERFYVKSDFYTVHIHCGRID